MERGVTGLRLLAPRRDSVSLRYIQIERGKDQEIFSIAMVVTVTWLPMKGCARQEGLRMTRYLIVIDVMKRQENSGKK